jgi:hypothetical protein
MAQLGNVFEGLDDGSPRGPDLRVSVEVPRAALGGSLHARIPPRLAHAGTLVERADAEQDVVLHLPATLPPGAVLRLRGQGGVLEQGQPGDLFVAVELVDRAPRPEERVSHENVVSPTLAAPSSTLTWLILLAFALVAATTVAVLFA